MNLADKIIQLRKKKGWSQEELAEMINGDTPVRVKVGKQSIHA